MGSPDFDSTSYSSATIFSRTFKTSVGKVNTLIIRFYKDFFQILEA
jgi:hypothetical protein